METHKNLVIGIFGFGTVGEGLYQVLHKTPSLKAYIKKICIKHPQKKRNAPTDLFTTHPDDLLLDKEINVIVEVIDNADAAFDIVTTALKNGKAVVSASKKMIAEHLPELLQLQQETELPFLYEAAACASIPVIRNLEEYYDNDLLHSIKGIINGSTNFILSKMFEDQLPFADALLLAQHAGFAESNPKLDVEGFDAVNKWSILLNHAYGIVENPKNLLFTGIQNIQLTDAQTAKEQNAEIKLVAQAKKLKNGKVAAMVLPQFVTSNDQLSFVKNEYNGVVIESGFADKQFFYGKGAGSFPTASAVLSDLSALRYHYRYEYKKLYHHAPHELTTDYFVKVYMSFADETYIPKEKFEHIDDLHITDGRIWLTGVIHASVLHENNWWKENTTSLILTSDPVIEKTEVSKLNKSEYELASA